MLPLRFRGRLSFLDPAATVLDFYLSGINGGEEELRQRQRQSQGDAARWSHFPAVGQHLHILDRIWQRLHLRGKLKAHLVRYADDFVVLCRRDVEEPLKVLCHGLERLGLTLNEAKTHIVDATETSLTFLGFTMQMSRGERTGKPCPNVRPADKSLTKIKARLTKVTGRELTAVPPGDIVGNVNRGLRSWANYFRYRNSSLAMSKVRNHAEDRLRTHLMKRHMMKDRGTGLRRFPSADLYGRYGLHKVPAVVGWRSAQASA